MYNPIKWSGSKKPQAKDIISCFPSKIKTYYEPFIGSASVLFELINSNIEVERYVANDICKPLIDIYKLIQSNPLYISIAYEEHWNNLQDNGSDYYYKIRKEFNKHKKPEDFLFLTRTCVNGMSRFNKKGEFNTSFHVTRKGINPETLKKVIMEWSSRIQKIEFLNGDYKNISPTENDYVYLDPPYAGTKGMYYGTIDYSELWNWLKGLPCGFALSFDGLQGDKDNTYDVPSEIYNKHLYVNSGISSFKKLHNEVIQVKESLYLK